MIDKWLQLSGTKTKLSCRDKIKKLLLQNRMIEMEIMDTEDVGNNEVLFVRMNSSTRVKRVWQSRNNIAKLADELKSRWRRINRISGKFY